MNTFANLLPVVARQVFGTQTLNRIPEPTELTEAEENVQQYDRVMTTKLAIAYAVYLEYIYRTRQGTASERALDLACGPGHFTMLMHKYLSVRSLVGIDLSEPMVQAAAANGQKYGCTDFQFENGDATNLVQFEDQSFDLTTFTDAAHHLPTIADVTSVLCEMDRVTKPEGLVFLADLSRLKSETATERYVYTLGADYHRQGLVNFFDDFHASMYAAWTAMELQSAIPENSSRTWYHLAPRILPTVQCVFGIPRTQASLFKRDGFPWPKHEFPFDASLATDWKMLRRSLTFPKISQSQQKNLRG